MKNPRLLTALIMVVLSLIALSTAAYAWFSNNTAVTLAGLDVNVTAAEGIQVSTDATTWKATLSIADITDNAYAGNKNQVPSLLTPVSTVGSQSTGTFAMFNGVLVEAGSVTLDATAAAAEADGSTGNYVAFDLFIKSATTEAIWLDTGSGVVASGTSVGLEYSSRVAFFYQGNDATSTPATAIALLNGTSGTQKIWEPNALTHTTVALASGATAGVKSSYYGIKAIGTGLTITNFAGDTTHFAVVSTITPDTDGAPFAETGPNTLFTVQPGINKIRIYMWIEGQDIDNENSVSLGVTGITTTIKFKKAA